MWEYLHLTVPQRGHNTHNTSQSHPCPELDTLGAQGWDVVSFQPFGRDPQPLKWIYLLKRPARRSSSLSEWGDRIQGHLPDGYALSELKIIRDQTVAEYRSMSEHDVEVWISHQAESTTPGFADGSASSPAIVDQRLSPREAAEAIMKQLNLAETIDVEPTKGP